MLIQFTIHYHTNWGQQLYVCGNTPELGNWDTNKALLLTLSEGERWEGHLEYSKTDISLEYKYFVKNELEQTIFYEWGEPRTLALTDAPFIELRDAWRDAYSEENTLHASVFTRAIMQRDKPKTVKKAKQTKDSLGELVLQLNAPRIGKHCVFGVIGSTAALGNWQEEAPVVMADGDYPIWKVSLSVPSNAPIFYKYVIVDTQTKQILAWEQGENRVFFPNPAAEKGTTYIQTDEKFRYPNTWRGAGVAIPVFSLRSEQANGVGEFTDIPLLVDWGKKTGMKVVQILPINDTTANHIWTDSYPYAAISVFALHPIYVNPQKIAKLKDKTLSATFETTRQALNVLPQIDYEGVMQLKWAYFKALYEQEKDRFLADETAQAFIDENAHWLKPYAAFCYLRDTHQTSDFSQWGKYAVYNAKQINTLLSPKYKDFDKIALHYFIQYHAHLQLLSAANYARKQGMALKGDIPIGIYRHSVDAWTAPELYNMNGQAGAPPDAFAIEGQNWGFPTYNWDEMAKDGYAWWKQRLTQLAAYFDAFRIDHILGFFRIWEIPLQHIQGLMGVFNPALPLSYNELESKGLYLDYDRFCTPYIREYMLWERFGGHTEEVKSLYLEGYGYGCYQLKYEVRTQQQVEAIFAEMDGDKGKNEYIKKGLFSLINEVLFFQSEEGNGYHPRISMSYTNSFRDLDDATKRKVEEIYGDYFYVRHNQFWRDQAMQKLPALVNATDMLICGEDLGMIPASVPGVMKELNILSLEIQRMPAGATEFGHPNNARYLSVITPSSHDMSTIRGWWEENIPATQRFYNQVLLNHGSAPFFCEPWIARQIIEQHLHSPAMWAIFPIQDLLAIDGDLRNQDTHIEQINVPANPKHYWRYRFHLNMEELLAANEFNEQVAELISKSGRNTTF